VLLVDHQVGLCSGVVDLDVLTLKHNVVALAKAAKVLGVPTIVTATAPECMWGLASGTFSLTKREMGLLRLAQAGVIVTDYATTMVEILKDNASSLANDVYAALDMPFATLVGQIFAANTKQASTA